MSAKRVALISSSTRESRVGPYITRHIESIIKSLKTEGLEVSMIDLADENLPLFDETTIPMQHPAENPTPHYARPHARAWSEKVASYDGFVFITPQYNWSIPASLKSAIDYLYQEWTNKPAGIVSYGFHGGDKAAGHLNDVLQGLQMKTLETKVQINLDMELLATYAKEGKIPDVKAEAWKEAGVDEGVHKLWDEMKVALSTPKTA